MKKKELFWSFAGVAILVLLWYLLAKGANEKLILKIPMPWETLKTFFKNLRERSFWAAVGNSLWHISAGYVTGGLLGGIFGVLSGNSAIFKGISSPLQHLVRAVPVAAFIIVAWLWIPSDILPVFISGLMVMPIVWSHTESGMEAADKKCCEMAKVYGWNPLKILFGIKMPFTMPQFRKGCLTALGIAWKSGIAAEVICNPGGTLGALLQSGKNSIEYEEVFAVTIMIVLLSVLLENIVRLVWREQKV